jgi:hypothetical protein
MQVFQRLMRSGAAPNRLKLFLCTGRYSAKPSLYRSSDLIVTRVVFRKRGDLEAAWQRGDGRLPYWTWRCRYAGPPCRSTKGNSELAITTCHRTGLIAA